GAVLSGPAIVGSGTNTQIWMANTEAAQLTRWMVGPNSVCMTNDTGTNLVTSTAVTNFFSVALDRAGNIYTCARTGLNGDPSPRVFRFGSISAAAGPETNALWAVGAGDDTYAGASGIAVDPTGKYVAVSFQGPDGPFTTNGNTKVLWATNGALAANIDLGVVMQGDENHADTDCAWDAVGNLYYIDFYFSAWRAVSPPGTNQSATVALGAIQFTGNTNVVPTSIQFTKISASATNVVLNFSGGTNDPASAYILLSSPLANGSYAPVQNATISKTSPGLFQATVPRNGPTQFFRIRR
ncbi:MAG TPA: hypothetical protein VKY92_18085, partial [Verrucomicrobiae bacterium]|nr:hypothetical protein [Verrucomicrobiae bacterium]